MKLSKEEVEEIYQQILARQSYTMTFIGALAGFSAGLGLFILFALAGATFVVTLFIPAFFVGFGAKFLGKPFEIKYKIIPGVLGMLIYVIGIYFVFTANEIYLALTPVNFIIAYYFSKATLTKAEVRAVWQANLG